MRVYCNGQLIDVDGEEASSQRRKSDHHRSTITAVRVDVVGTTTSQCLNGMRTCRTTQEDAAFILIPLLVLQPPRQLMVLWGADQ